MLVWAFLDLYRTQMLSVLMIPCKYAGSQTATVQIRLEPLLKCNQIQVPCMDAPNTLGARPWK